MFTYPEWDAHGKHPPHLRGWALKIRVKLWFETMFELWCQRQDVIQSFFYWLMARCFSVLIKNSMTFTDISPEFKFTKQIECTATRLMGLTRFDSKMVSYSILLMYLVLS